MNELNENSFYPQKPIFEEKKESGNWIKTLLSMALFIGTFLLIFEEQLSFVLMLVLVLFVHELGHFLLMKLFKYENVKMLFVPLMGAFVQGKKKQYSQFESLLVVGAGPFPGIILGVLFLFLFQINLDANYFLISILFFALNLINLLPLDPLDGGQLFKLLLRKNSDLFLLIFSFTSSMILILLGLYLENWYLTIFGFFMGFRVRNMQRNYIIRNCLKQENINYVKDYTDLTNQEYSQIKEIILENSKSLKKFKDMDEGDDADRLVAQEVNSILVVPMQMNASWWLKLLILLFWIASFILPVYFITQIEPDVFDYGIFTK
jgi:stage IV sporulation protein FB